MLLSLSPPMATLSALTTMTKSPPSTLGVNVGLCLPRSKLAAATASRPSTTSVASMTYHECVVSPAFGVYVDTAVTSPVSGGSRLTRVPAGHQRREISATSTDPRPRFHPASEPALHRMPRAEPTCDNRCRSKRVPSRLLSGSDGSPPSEPRSVRIDILIGLDAQGPAVVPSSRAVRTACVHGPRTAASPPGALWHPMLIRVAPASTTDQSMTRPARISR